MLLVCGKPSFTPRYLSVKKNFPYWSGNALRSKRVGYIQIHHKMVRAAATPHVLLIEDDARMREVVELGLGARGFVVTSAPNGTFGLDLVRKLDVDLVLLDLVLPDMHGFAVLGAMRAAKPRLPVIVLTALDAPTSKIGGLDAGADDYITKPFSIEEMAARIRARLRWREDDRTILKAGPLTVDLTAHRALLAGREISLSARELTLLAMFLRHPGHVLSRSQLLQMVWDLDFDPGSNVVEVYVAALRRKIGAPFIETVRGMGYRFVVADEVSGETQGAG